jgi:hypothetical protein
MKQHIIDFLKYLENKDNRKVPIKAKLLYPDKFGPLTEEDLNVEGSLNLAGINVTTLPDNLTVEGGLWVGSTPLASLPNNLTVGGSLVIVNVKIKSLPDNLTVGADLELSGIEINAFPNNLKVGGSLYLWNTPLAKRMTDEEIRQEIKRKGGYVKRSIKIF